jgi:UDP-3-O-[3-hydroxymyristoyl] glucosamine N-acyltransferase
VRGAVVGERASIGAGSVVGAGAAIGTTPCRAPMTV